MAGVFQIAIRMAALALYLTAGVAAATPSFAADADKFGQIHSVAIISHLGDQFSFEQSGMTVFDNKLQYTSMADWGLDTFATRTLAGILGNRFTIKTVNFDSDQLDDCSDPTDCAALLPTNNTIDAYIVIYSSQSRGFGGPGQGFNGVGLFRVPGLFGAANAALHLVYGIAIIDAKTKAVIDWSGGQMSKSYFGDHPPPIQDMDISVWPETLPDLSPTQVQTINSAIRPLLDDSLQSTIDDLGLLKQ